MRIILVEKLSVKGERKQNILIKRSSRVVISFYFDFVRFLCPFDFFRKQRQIQNHLHQNQNQCVEQPNRMLANGPNHPGPGHEEIPMVDVSPKPVRSPLQPRTQSHVEFIPRQTRPASASGGEHVLHPNLVGTFCKFQIHIMEK